MYTYASDVAFIELRRRILEGRYAPGSFLSNQGLAVELDLSRTPVRDALRRLETEGLVVIAPRAGATVREFSTDEIVDLYILRTALEPDIASIAAERRSSIDVATMRGCVERFKAQHKKQAKEPADSTTSRWELANLDYQFHQAIVQAAHSKVMSEVYLRLQVWMTLYYQKPPKSMEFPLHFFNKMENVVAEHERVVDAIEKRDTEAARRLMTEHLSGLTNAARQWLHSAARIEPVDAS